jgi:spore germination protein YaaH
MPADITTILPEGYYVTDVYLEDTQRGDYEELEEHAEETITDDDQSTKSSGNELINLSRDFNELVAAIINRVQELTETTNKSVQYTYNQIERNDIRAANDQIRQLRDIIKQCDELEVDFLKIRQIGQIALDFKQRLQAIERSLT